MTPAALAAIHAACFDSTPRPWTPDEVAALLAAPGAIVATHPDGFALGRVAADEAELLTLAVQPEARRLGLGRALLGAFEAEARSRGAARGYLEVAETNAAALALYAGAGWQQAGYRRDYYEGQGRQRVGALVLVKNLASTRSRAGGSD